MKPTLQARSQATLENLLEAAESALAERGVEGTTVQEIAGRAGVSVGAVYRRFEDKDAVLRAVVERFFLRTHEMAEEQLDPQRLAGMRLEPLVQGFVRGLVISYETRQRLMREILLYLRAHPDTAFRRRLEAVNRKTLDLLAESILARRDEITHPDPEAAVGFGIVAVALVLREIVLFDALDDDDDLVPRSRLAPELSRMFMGYLKRPS